MIYRQKERKTEDKRGGKICNQRWTQSGFIFLFCCNSCGHAERMSSLSIISLRRVFMRYKCWLSWLHVRREGEIHTRTHKYTRCNLMFIRCTFHQLPAVDDFGSLNGVCKGYMLITHQDPGKAERKKQIKEIKKESNKPKFNSSNYVCTLTRWPL